MTAKPDAGILECDVQGQICPSTLLTALRRVNENREALRRGDLALAIVTDHRDAVVTIPEAMANMGYRVSVTQQGHCYRILIEGGPVRALGIGS
jgi:TusA-related sulfurtransferase